MLLLAVSKYRKKIGVIYTRTPKNALFRPFPYYSRTFPLLTRRNRLRTTPDGGTVHPAATSEARKTAPPEGSAVFVDVGQALLVGVLLIVAFCVAAHKLIDATSGVNQLHLTGVERVRRVGNFHLIHGIGFAVHLDGLFCRNGGPTQNTWSLDMSLKATKR